MNDLEPTNEHQRNGCPCWGPCEVCYRDLRDRIKSFTLELLAWHQTRKRLERNAARNERKRRNQRAGR